MPDEQAALHQKGRHVAQVHFSHRNDTTGVAQPPCQCGTDLPLRTVEKEGRCAAFHDIVDDLSETVEGPSFQGRSTPEVHRFSAA
jgi:hypothetical protein